MFGIQNRTLLSRVLQLAAVILAMTVAGAAPPAVSSSKPSATEKNVSHPVRALKITVLVTNLAGDLRAGDGEWGYSALVEVDGHRILYDTGASADMVLRNARALHIDLADIEDVVLSHNHNDHVGGLMTLRREFAKTSGEIFGPDQPQAILILTRLVQTRLEDADAHMNAAHSACLL
jgi:glyoxylase-like metal-dependent hydrolase (beta-lactamase superfamily II)